MCKCGPLTQMPWGTVAKRALGQGQEKSHVPAECAHGFDDENFISVCCKTTLAP